MTEISKERESDSLTKVERKVCLCDGWEGNAVCDCRANSDTCLAEVEAEDVKRAG